MPSPRVPSGQIRDKSRMGKFKYKNAIYNKMSRDTDAQFRVPTQFGETNSMIFP